LLDTVTNLLWHYKTASNGWIQAGGGTAVTTFSAGTTGLTPNTATSGAVTLGGTLAVANGGTGSTTQNFVDLTNDQTANGVKTFPNKVSVGGSTGVSLLANPAANGYGGFWHNSVTPASTNYAMQTNGETVLINGSTAVTIAQGGSGKISARSFGADVVGDFGIGINPPTQKLHVVGNGLFTGNVGIGSATPTTSGSGITFPATQSASTNVNTLDDYEEGTWTPAYEGLAGSAGSLAYASGFPTGRYTKIGRLVVATGEIELTNKGSWTSGVRIAGLPFNLSATEIAQGFCIAGFVDFAAGELYLNTRNTGGATPLFYIDKTKDNADREILSTTAVNNNSTFYFSLTYQTN
jgi:hypothetical protein